MRPDFGKIYSNLQKTAYPRQGKIKRCHLCENDPEQVIRYLDRKTRRRRIYSGLYTVIKSGDYDDGAILQVCRYCFLLGKQHDFLRPALPPGAARRKRRKISTI